MTAELEALILGIVNALISYFRTKSTPVSTDSAKPD